MVYALHIACSAEDSTFTLRGGFHRIERVRRLLVHRAISPCILADDEP